MNKTLAVARWEYVEKIKSKAFIISLFLMPVIMVGMGVVPTLLAARPDSETKVIGIIDRSGEMVAPLERLLAERYRLPDGQPNYLLRPISPGAMPELRDIKRVADSLVVRDNLEGYLVIPGAPLEDTVVEYRSQNIGNIRVTLQLLDALREIIAEKKLQGRGIDPALVKQLTKPVDMKTIKISKSGEEQESGFEQAFFTAYGFMMMMFVLVITSGQLLVRSMLEEKSNRVVEILMSSASANDLMAGKIIGLSALGLTQMGFWLLIGVAISLKFAITLISLQSAVVLFAYFILGYLLYAAIFVAAGSPVSTEQEAQQVTSYLTMFLLIPLVFAILVVQNPNSVLVKILTFFPLLTPSMMAMRVPLQMPSVLEIAVTMTVLGLSGVGAVWVAGKIFRTTILLVGKRPSVRELWRLVRTK